MKYKKMKSNKGASLLLTFLIITALLSIAIGVSRLSLGEIKLGRNIPNSLVAYYAAESGIERALYEDRHGGGVDFSDCLDSPTDSVCYEVQFSGISPNRTVKSNGSYKNIRRTIEITY
jgi:hypothetical protein